MKDLSERGFLFQQASSFTFFALLGGVQSVKAVEIQGN